MTPHPHPHAVALSMWQAKSKRGARIFVSVKGSKWCHFAYPVRNVSSFVSGCGCSDRHLSQWKVKLLLPPGHSPLTLHQLFRLLPLWICCRSHGSAQPRTRATVLLGAITVLTVIPIF